MCYDCVFKGRVIIVVVFFIGLKNMFLKGFVLMLVSIENLVGYLLVFDVCLFLW